MSTLDYLAGRKTLEEVDSPINGKLSAVFELGWGTYLKAGGLPQSGGLAKTIWEKSLKAVKRATIDNPPKTILVLGFAGGGIAQISRELWPDCTIYGVDIDPLMVDLGKKYLHWEETGAMVWIQDAVDFIADLSKNKKPRGKKSNKFDVSIADFNFDLICVDMYVGDSVPEKFSKLEFVNKVKKLLAKDGTVVFNRLYGKEDKKHAANFEKVLTKAFKQIDKVYPAANIMFLCKE